MRLRPSFKVKGVNVIVCAGEDRVDRAVIIARIRLVVAVVGRAPCERRRKNGLKMAP